MNFVSIRSRLRRLSWRARPRDPRQRLGRRGERAAARYLKRHRHRMVARNYRCPAGEIDLICVHGDTIVFVEVKSRLGDEAPDLQEAFHKTQWTRVEQAARYFLLHRSTRDRPCRFDAVMVVWPHRGSPRIEHYEDAFQPRRR